MNPSSEAVAASSASHIRARRTEPSFELGAHDVSKSRAYSSIPAGSKQQKQSIFGRRRTRSQCYSSSAAVAPAYFHPNLPSAAATATDTASVDNEAKRRKRLQDIEEVWATAHRRDANNEPPPSSPFQAHAEDAAAAEDHDVLAQKLRSERARFGNAERSFDEVKDVHGGEQSAALHHHHHQHHHGYRDLVMRCTTLDGQGSWQTRNTPLAKSALCVQHGLQPRDLRKIDSRIPNVLPTILVRREAILVNILHVRMLIKANTVTLFDVMGTIDSQLQENFVRELSATLKLGYRNSGGMPYEFRALEAALSSVATALEEEMKVHKAEVTRLVGSLETHIVVSELHTLLQYSRRLAGFQRRAKSVQAAIDEVLEQDDDLSAMYLSEEIEMLLESFSKQVEAIVSEADSIVGDLHQTQDVIELILDSSRNALLTLDLQASIATMGLASGAFIASLFGMNLHTSLETHPSAFWVTTGLAGGLVAMVTLAGLRRVYRLRKIGLGQGVFGEYAPVPQQGPFAARAALGNGYGRQGLYYGKGRVAKRDGRREI
ncbi:MAG: magnesium ion transporter [Cyphobasidiales sp. Tagirdzhanova-0007]|nr:MAG: magnesium ion transporter [Cyphobasidiales sp. Tagirdzhanova-0007]